MKTAEQIIAELRSLADTAKVDGMSRFGIKGSAMLGVSMPSIRAIAKKSGKNHDVAIELWNSGIHEARILASLVEEPARVTERQMESWAKKFDSWDVCDQCCLNIFDRTPFAHSKAVEWSRRKEEFVKRAGFALMAVIAVHDKKAPDTVFLRFLRCIEREAGDDRNFVKKAVNWALRQIGKRSPALNRQAVSTAMKIMKRPSPAARWIASDALRELSDTRIAERVLRHGGRAHA